MEMMWEFWGSGDEVADEKDGLHNVVSWKNDGNEAN